MSGTILPLTGNEAAAEAMRQINPDVVAAYPITPQTELMHKFSEYVADGIVDTEMILVESEHSAMSACVGASAAGARVMTATSANGLALMWEIVYIAASLRLPVVMPVINRALSGPINIHCDHSDSMGCRDSGWIQFYCENSQEAYDNMVQAIKIAEDDRVLLPVMPCYDGFIISHTTERVEILEDNAVVKFIGQRKPYKPLLDIDNPVTYGPLDLQDYYFEHKKQESEAQRTAKKVILEVGKAFEKISGRGYGFFEEYRTDDAEHILVALGSTCGTAKCAADELRSKGKKVGVLKLRVFRPFPAPELAKALSRAKTIGVMDRADSFNGVGGPLASEIRSALYGGKNQAKIYDFIYGLGGRDISLEEIKTIFENMMSSSLKEETIYVGVRE